MTSGSAETSSSSKILQISSSWPALQCLEDFWGCPFLPWCYLRVMQRLPRRSSRMLMFETKQWWHGMLLHKGHPPEQWRALCWFVLAGGWYSPTSCSALLPNETRKKSVLYSPLPLPPDKMFLLKCYGVLCFAAVHTLLCPSYLSCIHVAETFWTLAGKNLSGLLFYCTFLRLSQLIYFPGRNKCTQKVHMHYESDVFRMCQNFCTSYTGDKRVCNKSYTFWMYGIYCAYTNCLHSACKNWIICHRWVIVTTHALQSWDLASCQLPLSLCFWEPLV